MPETAQPHPEIQFVQLSPLEAEILEKNPDAIVDIGHMALDGAEIVGVVTPGEGGQPQLINLSNDPGVRINTVGNFGRAEENLAKYGSPEAALAQIKSEQMKTVEEGISPVEKLANAVGLSEILTQADALIKSIESGNADIRTDLASAVQELDQLKSALRVAAESSLWSGNYLNQYPELINRINLTNQSLAEITLKDEDILQNETAQAAAYKNGFDSVADDINSSNDIESAAELNELVDNMSLALQTLSRRESTTEAVKMMHYTVDTLSNMQYEGNLTVSDSLDMVMQLADRLNEMENSLKYQIDVENVTDALVATKKFLQKEV